MLPDTSGIYLISYDDHQYIGQAQSIRYRIRKHFESLARNQHRNARLQNIYNKYGNVFEVSVLVECPVELLDQYEQEWLDVLRFYPKEYVLNMCFEPGTTRGYKYTEQQRQEHSARLKGKKKSIESFDNYSRATKEKWQSGIMKGKPKKTFQVKDPDGVIYTVTGLSDFAKEHGLSMGMLSMLVNGKIFSYKLWSLV